MTGHQHTVITQIGDRGLGVLGVTDLTNYMERCLITQPTSFNSYCILVIKAAIIKNFYVDGSNGYVQ